MGGESATNYCPYCWEKVGDRDETCAACGERLTDYHSLSYGEKLLLALHHPIRESRTLAIHILGKLRSEKALEEFEKQLVENDDIFDLYEIMMALTNYACNVKVPWFMTMIAHPSPPVGRLARRLLDEADAAECRPSQATVAVSGKESSCVEE